MTVDEAQEHAAKIRAGRDAGKQPLTIGSIILALDDEVRRQREALHVMSVNEGKLHLRIAQLETRERDCVLAALAERNHIKALLLEYKIEQPWELQVRIDLGPTTNPGKP